MCRVLSAILVVGLGLTSIGFADGQMLSGLDGRIGDLDQTLRDLESLPQQKVVRLSKKASLSLDDLRAGNLAWRAKLKNLHVGFDQTIRQERNDDGTPLKVKEDRKHFVFAMLGEKRLGKWFADDRPNVSGETHLCDGKTYTVWMPVQPFAQVSPGKSTRPEQLAQPYVRAANIDLVSPEQSQKSLFYLPEALSHPEYFSVLPELQEVDGAECHVVASDADIFWIAAGEGFSLRRRVSLDVVDAARKSAVLHYVLCPTDFSEVAEGIWLPHRLNFLAYAQGGQPQSQGKLARHDTIQVRQLQVNNVDESVFDEPIPPGKLVIDETIGRKYLMPPKPELLPQAIDLSEPINSPNKPRPVPVPRQ